MIPSLDEVGFYLRGIWRLVRNDPSGMQYLDLTDRGFWRSFWAYFYMLPVYIFYWIEQRNRYGIDNPEATPGLGFFLRLAAIDLITIVSLIVVLAVVSRPLGFAHRYVHWLIAANWYGLAISYVLIIPTVLATVMGSEITGLLLLVLIILSIWASFRIYRFALAGNIPVTIFVITMEFSWAFLSYFLFQ